VNHFNYCHWQIHTGVAAEYSTRMFLNTHAYSNLGYRITVASYS